MGVDVRDYDYNATGLRCPCEEFMRHLVVSDTGAGVVGAILVGVEFLVFAADLTEYREARFRRADVVHQTDVDDDRTLDLVNKIVDVVQV